MENLVSFPGLGINNLNLDPVAFNLLGKDIFWYGIIIAAGFLLSVLFGYYESRRVGLNPEYISDVLLWVVPGAILGARLYYVLFSWRDYVQEPAKIFAVWEGGLAIYGGLIASVVIIILFCRAKKIAVWRLLDVAAICVPIGQSIGRWGNFINKEAYGLTPSGLLSFLGIGGKSDYFETGLPWRMEVFSQSVGSFISVHPTFFYESLWNALGFLALLLLRKRKPFEGYVFWCYVAIYGFGRFWIEGLRADSLFFGPVRVSQMVALACVVVGLFAIVRGSRAAANELAADVAAELSTASPEAEDAPPSSEADAKSEESDLGD